ncbi:Tm-1-like ATP-binding domain-containing protein [Nonomuraea sp. B12E4]|uniref:Tm-1-like ATP-binding domain-containing protein n=1 Tax=Nonomuraea sp. B12E4 TaxID=3153564 RepID=UPI00325CE93D
MAVLLLGTFDTKGEEYAHVRDLIIGTGQEVVLVDVGVMGTPALPADVGPAAVAEAAGTSLEALRTAADRGAALHAMAAGAAAVARDLYAAGRVSGMLALGGSGGSSVAAAAMRVLPVGLPKLLVSTMAGGDVSAYVGQSDMTLMYSVVDVAGINSISRQILGNAAAAISAMAAAYDIRRATTAASGSRRATTTAASDPLRAAAGDATGAGAAGGGERPLVAATMFGVTTPAVNVARARLEDLGYEVLVFHATGSGGRAMEALVAGGYFAGVLDLTTTELADELVGGVLSAGPERLTAAGAAGVPQVVSLGAVDMVNFGPMDTVPDRFRDRTLLVHNPTVTLMRTTPEETAELGRVIGAKLVAATGPTALFVPRGGVSAVDVDGGPFWDPVADAACFDAVLAAVAGSDVEVVESELDINAEQFAVAAADRLHELIQKA